MFRRFRGALVVGGVAGLWVALAVGPAAAQGRRELPQLTVGGTIQEIGRGMIGVKSDTDQLWLLQVQPNSRIEVKGTAKADFLAPGQYILFTAKVDGKGGKVDEKISKLTIFTPDQRRQPGAFPDQGFGGGEKAGEKPGEKPAEKPAFGAPTFGAPTFGAPSPAPGKGRRSRTGGKGAVAAAQTFEIHGQITGMKNGKLSLRVPNPYFTPTLVVEVPEEAEIDVEVSGPAALGFVRPGDKILARGIQVAQNAGRITEADVTLSQPLSSGQETPAKRRGAVKGRLKKGADSDEPAAEDESPKPAKKPAKKTLKSRRKEAPEATEPEESPKE